MVRRTVGRPCEAEPRTGRKGRCDCRRGAFREREHRRLRSRLQKDAKASHGADSDQRRHNTPVCSYYERPEYKQGAIPVGPDGKRRLIYRPDDDTFCFFKQVLRHDHPQPEGRIFLSRECIRDDIQLLGAVLFTSEQYHPPAEPAVRQHAGAAFDIRQIPCGCIRAGSGGVRGFLRGGNGGSDV